MRRNLWRMWRHMWRLQSFIYYQCVGVSAFLCLMTRSPFYFDRRLKHFIVDVCWQFLYSFYFTLHICVCVFMLHIKLNHTCREGGEKEREREFYIYTYAIAYKSFTLWCNLSFASNIFMLLKLIRVCRKQKDVEILHQSGI